MGLVRNIFKGAVTIGLIGIIAGGLTKPDKQAHAEKIAEEIIASVLNADVDRMDEISEVLRPQVIEMAGKLIGRSIEVNDRLFFNVAEMKTAKGEKIVSVGAFGHVFTLVNDSSDKLTEELSNLFNQVIK